MSETPSTPPPEPTEIQIAASPAHQRDLHQKKRGRSSGIPPMNFNNPNDFSSSPSDGESVIDDDNGTEPFITADEEVESSNSDDDDSVEDPSISSEFDANDVTAPSNGDSSTSSSDKLEAALRQAANQAGTQGIDYDENGDITMELVDDEVTSAFQPWMKKGKYVPHSMNDLSILQTQENTNPFSPAFKACVSEMHLVDDVERTMEFTQAVGAILPTKTDLPCSPKGNRPKSASDSQRRSSGASQQSSGGDSMIGDETMDLTTAVGKIQSNAHAPEAFRNTGDDGSVNEDEELTMEFTSVFGGLIGQNKQPENMKKPLIENYLEIQQIPESGNQRQSKEPSHHEDGIDVAFTASNILPSITERTEPLEDQTSGMDIPAAVGAILPPVLSAGSKSQAKLLMEREIDAGQLSGSSFQAGFPVAPSSSNHVATVASETGSPSLMTAQRRSNAKKSLLSRHSTTPKASSRQSTPSKKPVTPSKQETPLVVRPTTPGKTPPSKNIAMRTGSPKKLFKAEIRAENSTPKSLSSISLVNKGEESSDIVPKFMLKPEIRRASGLGIDREGLGSPRVTALLNRRRSIGEDAMVFTPQNQAQRGVRFENPKVMKEELERQWAEDERRESRRGTLQTETDSQELDEEKDVTTSLKDMIESLTPKKKRLNGRKSLHVGAAKGLLGKRPAELDDDEDEDSSPKRIKGREGSPVKKVRLPAPPSKIETTGRITRSVRRSLTEAGCDNNADTATKPLSPLKKPHISKPGVQPRSTDAEESASAGKSLVLVDKVHAENPIIPNLSEEEDRIHLQEFLNMTSIRFMELTTTKRRLTVAPTNILESSAKKPGKATGIDSATDRESELESCVVAGGCTIPMLELYQHVGVPHRIRTLVSFNHDH